MSIRSWTLIWCSALMLCSCKKDEIVVSELNTNPFDADYAGPDVFTFLDASSEVELVNGTPVRVLTLEIQVHTEYFGRPTTYFVSVDGSSNIPSNSIPNGRLTILRSGVEIGEEYCPRLRLLNNGSFGAGNTVCATVE